MKRDMSEVHYAGFFTRLAVLLLDLFIVGIIASAIIKLLGADANRPIVLLLAWLYWVPPLVYWETTVGGKLLGIKIYDMQGHYLGFLKATFRFVLSIAPFILYRLVRQMQYEMMPMPEPMVQMLPQLLYILPPFLMFFTSKRQMLHDIAVGSVMLDVSGSREGGKEKEGIKVRSWGQSLLRIAVIVVFLVTFGYVFIYMSVFLMWGQHQSNAYNASFHTHYTLDDRNDTMIRFYRQELEKASKSFVGAEGMYAIFEADVKRDLATNCIEFALRVDHNVSDWIEEGSRFRKSARNKYADTKAKITKAKANEDYMGRHFYDYDLNDVNHITEKIADIWADENNTNKETCRALMPVDEMYRRFVEAYIQNREETLAGYKADIVYAPEHGTLDKAFYRKEIGTTEKWLEELYGHFPDLLAAKKRKQAMLERSKAEALKKAQDEKRNIEIKFQKMYENARKSGRSPLFIAAEYGRVNDMKRLLAQGEDPNAQDEYAYTPLSKTLNNYEATKVLLEHGANPNMIGPNKIYTPFTHQLRLAAPSESNIVRLYLTHGAEVNYQYHGSETPLTIAAKGCNKYEIVKLLLEHGADPSIKDNFGFSTAKGLFRYCKDPDQAKKMIKLIKKYEK